MGRHTDPVSHVALSAAANIQIRNKLYYETGKERWTDDVRPQLALYTLLAYGTKAKCEPWLYDYMVATEIIEQGFAPTGKCVARLKRMRRSEMALMYRHGAVIDRLSAKRLIRVDPETGAVIIRNPTVLWERMDMQARLYDEAVDRMEQMFEDYEDEQ